MKQLATLLFAIGMAGMFYLARERNGRTSKALWIPGLWLLISGSRNVAEWLQMSAPVGDAERYIEGNPIDRNALTALLLLGLLVLFTRRELVVDFLRRNIVIVLYFLYCGFSVLWSDFPDVSSKRWIRSLGDLVMVLVIVSDPNPVAAVKRVLMRTGFILLPLSLLFVRYYPDLGRAYSRWTGRMFWTGVTTEKNSLGLICMIFGITSLWHLLEWYRTDRNGRTRGVMVAHATLLAIAVWLLIKADSATSFACFIVGGGVMCMTSWPLFGKKPWVVHALVLSVIFVAIAALFLGASDLVEFVGRDSTLTGRTDIWQLVIPMLPSQWFGAGYESFWLGSRLKTMWSYYPNHPNQAHNGYIEIYLNLGRVGVALLAANLLVGYRRLTAAVPLQTNLASLRLAFFVTAVIYNCTEGGFKMMHPAWITLLLALAVVPAVAGEVEVPALAPHARITKNPGSIGSFVPVSAASRAHTVLRPTVEPSNIRSH